MPLSIYDPPSDLTTARELLDSRVQDYPLPRSPAHYTWRRRYVQNAAHFAKVALDTADSIKTTAYLVDEPITRKQGQVLFFDRLFATIPDTWEEPSSVAFRYPQIPVEATYGSVVTADSVGSGSATGIFTITESGHGLSVGNLILVSYKATRTTTGVVQQAFGEGLRVLTVPTANTFTIMLGLRGNWTFASLTYRTLSVLTGRRVEDVDAPCIIRHEYFLPGVSSGITTINDVVPLRREVPIDGDGNQVDVLSAATIPTITQYREAAEAGAMFVVNCQRLPYLGNIVELRTTLVPYR